MIILLLLACVTHIYIYSLRTSRSWWITQSTQQHRRVATIFRQQLQALALQPGVWGISCLVLLPFPCNDSSLYLSFSNFCEATVVTHTKRINRNLLRKETSFVCYTSSVLRRSWHMKQKERITDCWWDQNSRLQKLSTIATLPLNSHNTVQRTQIATAIRYFWLTKHSLRV